MVELLKSQAEIEGAIALMHPVAREACRAFTVVLSADPNIMEDDARVNDALRDSMLQSMLRAGFAPDRMKQFFDDQHVGVFKVALSIIIVSQNQEERSKKAWGWIGTAAAAGIGGLLGAFFG